MKFTTKVLWGGLALILFIGWLSFYYLPAGEANTEEPLGKLPLSSTEAGELQGGNENGNENGKEIDLVYVWNPPSSQSYRKAYTHWMKEKDRTSSYYPKEVKTQNYNTVNYLPFFLRSVTQNLPFIRTLIIVAPDGKEYMNALSSLNFSSRDPRVRVVKHSEFLPLELLPVFNPAVVETFAHQIPNISPQFLLVDRFTFFTNEIQSIEVFVDQKSLDRPLWRIPLFIAELDYIPPYIISAIEYTSSLIPESKKTIDSFGPALIDVATMRRVHETFAKEIATASLNRFPHYNDIHIRRLYFDYIVSTGFEVPDLLSKMTEFDLDRDGNIQGDDEALAFSQFIGVDISSVANIVDPRITSLLKNEALKSALYEKMVGNPPLDSLPYVYYSTPNVLVSSRSYALLQGALKDLLGERNVKVMSSISFASTLLLHRGRGVKTLLEDFFFEWFGHSPSNLVAESDQSPFKNAGIVLGLIISVMVPSTLFLITFFMRHLASKKSSD
eukprot:TRINITY_DN1570_c0_g1_i1.p1 TRINITY_DN1570_c0_g1~~TRINITY_DN1570_c0_g1_i1.p1  ORF type:complete len:499 (-),score=101.55 TRINITY_DN1570_c0_g1_i1:162-1658(-)